MELDPRSQRNYEFIEKIFEDERLSLVNILGGAAIEKFDHCLNSEVLPNVSDINTSKKARKITLEVAIAPADDARTLFVFAIRALSTLVPRDSVKGSAEIKLDSQGRRFAKERYQRELQMTFGNVKNIEE